MMAHIGVSTRKQTWLDAIGLGEECPRGHQRRKYACVFGGLFVLVFGLWAVLGRRDSASELLRSQHQILHSYCDGVPSGDPVAPQTSDSDNAYLAWLKHQDAQYKSSVCNTQPRFVENLREHVPFERDFIENNMLQTLPKFEEGPFEANSRGYVFTTPPKPEMMDMILRTVNVILELEPEAGMEVWFTYDDYPRDHPLCNGELLHVDCKVFYSEETGLTPDTLPPIGYAFCIYAIVLSRFQHVFFLDLDAVPMASTKYLFDEPAYKETGQLFWADLWGTDSLFDAGMTAWTDSQLWDFVRVNPYNTREMESSILVIDKARNWKEVNLAMHMSRHQQFMYRKDTNVGPRGQQLTLHGDKDVWRLAFLYFRTKFHMAHPVSLGRVYAFLAYRRNSIGHIGLRDTDHVLFVHQPKDMALPRAPYLRVALLDTHCNDPHRAFYHIGFSNYWPCLQPYDYQTGQLQPESAEVVTNGDDRDEPEHEEEEEETWPVVVHLFEAKVQAGFAGYDEPQVVFPLVASLTDDGFAVGDAAADAADLIWPIERGIVKHWDALEAVFAQIFSELMINPEKHKIILGEFAPGSKEQRERLMTMLFHSFGVQGIAFLPVSSLLSSGRAIGVFVDVSWDVTQIIPMSESVPIPGATIRAELGMRDVVQAFLDNLKAQDGMQTCRNLYEAMILFEKLADRHVLLGDPLSCNVLLKDLRGIGGNTVLNESLTLSSDDLQQAAATLLTGTSTVPGIPDLILEAISKLPLDVRELLTSSIVLSGSGTIVSGFAQELQERLAKAAPSTLRVNTLANPDRLFAWWVSGSILGSLSGFADECVSKNDFVHDPAMAASGTSVQWHSFLLSRQYVGHRAVERRFMLRLSHPIATMNDRFAETNEVPKMEEIYVRPDVDELLEYLFLVELQGTSIKGPLVLSTANTHPAAISMLLQTAFAQGFDTVTMVDAASAALVALGRSTGLIVDVGHQSTRITPIVDSTVLEAARKIVPWGGRNASATLQKLLRTLDHGERGRDAANEITLVDNIKEEVGYVRAESNEEADVEVISGEMGDRIPPEKDLAHSEFAIHSAQHLALEDVEVIAAEGCNISDTEQVQAALALFHELGMLFYFREVVGLRDFVVLDPQWLIRCFSMVIRDVGMHPFCLPRLQQIEEHMPSTASGQALVFYLTVEGTFSLPKGLFERLVCLAVEHSHAAAFLGASRAPLPGPGEVLFWLGEASCRMTEQVEEGRIRCIVDESRAQLAFVDELLSMLARLNEEVMRNQATFAAQLQVPVGRLGSVQVDYDEAKYT
ncbi:Actin, partial [Hondaea fermentalgiana]